MNPSIISKHMKSSSGDFVYQTLRESIIRLDLEPGRLLSENEISGKLQISRTPVREAFIRLSQEQLLEIFPQRGTFVSKIDPEQVEEARFVREHLEKAVVRLACSALSADHLSELETNLILFDHCVKEKNYTKLFELDGQFHEMIAKGSGKERIWSIIRQMNAHLDRVRMLSLASEFNWETIRHQHSEIIKAIREKDEDRAEHIMSEHLTLIVYDLEKLRNQYPDYLK